jgi:hypothetical protein
MSRSICAEPSGSCVTLHSPETALCEMARAVRRGGCVLAQDFDSDLTVLDAADRSLARHIAEVLDAAVPNP